MLLRDPEMEEQVVRELKADDLKRSCCPDNFGFNTTDELEVLDGVIEQERAVRALKLGVAIDRRNYNVYVAGFSGTGRTTIVREIVKDAAARRPVPSDWVLVQNFREKECPKAISLPPGKGREFAEAMDWLVETLKNDIPKAFRAREYQEEVQDIVSGSLSKEQEYFALLSKKAAEIGFVVKSTKTGLVTIPTINDKAISNKEYEALEDEQKEAIEERRRILEPLIHDFVSRTRNIESDTQDLLKKRQNRLARRICSVPVRRVRRRFARFKGIGDYLTQVQDNILSNVTRFLKDEAAPQPSPVVESPEREFADYKVNVVVDNSDLKGAPVIVETRPTYYNLFGKIEKKVENGVYFTDFTMIKAGSVLRANGGYLLINTNDLFNYPLVWENLKSVLRYRQITIEDMGEHMGYLPTSGLRPEAIPMDIKVILIGPPYVYELLNGHDEDFQKLFQIKSEFDYEVKWSDATIMEYARFIATTCKNEKLRPVTRAGVARVIEYGSRLVESQNKITLQFNEICNILIEADYEAGVQGKAVVDAPDIDKVVNDRRFRLGLLEDKVRDEILEGSVYISHTGECVGEINGLAVYEVGGFSFGKPSKISAVVYAGKGGIVNIEREARLSGQIHSKGVMIISGFLGHVFGQKRPLSLSVSVCFEQSYGQIDGDSASAAELFAILSALSGVPIQSRFAVTGSVNQHGQIQPIGGVNEKIEAWFRLCLARGLSGDQGVVIPASNAKNLMLHQDVIDAVEKGVFHIYPINTIAEGIAILMGREAGHVTDELEFTPADSVYAQAWETLKRFDEGDDDDEEGCTGCEEEEPGSCPGC